MKLENLETAFSKNEFKFIKDVARSMRPNLKDLRS